MAPAAEETRRARGANGEGSRDQGEHKAVLPQAGNGVSSVQFLCTLAGQGWLGSYADVVSLDVVSSIFPAYLSLVLIIGIYTGYKVWNRTKWVV